MGRSLSAKGAATRAAILESAHEVFKDVGYYGSSVSEITRRCGVSMATFYQYFKNKAVVFLELNDLILSRFSNHAESLSLKDLNFGGRLREIVQLIYEHTRDNFAFHRILGEAELTDQVTIAYYDAVARYCRDFIRSETQTGYVRPLDPNMIAYGLIGICYFNSLDWEEDAENLSQEELLDLITDLVAKGVNGPASWKRPSNWDPLSLPEPEPVSSGTNGPLTKGEITRKSIFQAAEKVFGQRGFNRTNIAEITREAGVAQGTFYVHFESKSDLIEGLVRYINHELRRELQRVVVKIRDRRDAERVGILTFFEFLRSHKRIYRIIPECEMISRPVFLWYYRKLASGYVRGLEQGILKKEIRDLPPVFLARSLMGFVHFIGLKKMVWDANTVEAIPDRLRQDLIEFVLFGLKTA
jgi:AcrR family transcriptional regulator